MDGIRLNWNNRPQPAAPAASTWLPVLSTRTRSDVLSAVLARSGSALDFNVTTMAPTFDGFVSYASRENPDPSLRPTLELVLPRTEIEIWSIEAFGADLNNPLIAADDADPDSDGESNLYEFATGQNPREGTLVSPSITSNGSAIEFFYTRGKASIADGVAYIIEWSDTLAADSWSPVGSIGRMVAETALTETRSVLLPMSGRFKVCQTQGGEMKTTMHTDPFKQGSRKFYGPRTRRISMKWKLPVVLTVITTVSAEQLLERTPADAYGGGVSTPQPLTPEAAKEVYRIPVPIADGPFDGTWKSFTPDKLKPEPAWWREAKIGIWFHWGPQSMGRNGDWYARFLYQQPPEGRKGRANGRFMYDEHLKRYGHPSEFGYMDVLNAWKAPDFDPKKLMDLYAACGARYILVQGAHHDNFDLWNSTHQPWNSVNVGPKRDIVGEMFAEARKHRFRVGMAFHADYSLWWYQPAFGSDKTGPRAGVPYDAAVRTKADGKGKWWDGLDPKDLYGIDLQAEALPGKNIRDGFFTPVRDVFVHPETRDFAKAYCLKWFNRLKQFVDDYDPDFIYTDGTEPFTGRGTAKGVISDATPEARLAHV